MTETHLYQCLTAGDFEAEINLEVPLKKCVLWESRHLYTGYVVEIIGGDDNDDLRQDLNTLA